MSRNSRMYFMLTIFTIIKLCTSIVIKPKTRNETVVIDFPEKRDLPKYINVINKILNYCFTHRNDVDFKFSVSLFFMHVNIKATMLDKAKLPSSVRMDLNNILKRNTKVLGFFSKMVREDKHSRDQAAKAYILKILKLFSNATKWAEGLRPYGPESLKDRVFERYTQWTQYVEDCVYNMFMWTPSRKHTNECVESLAGSIDQTRTKKCELPEMCFECVRYGTDFGFSLIDRIFMLTLARLGSGCYILSTVEDAYLMQSLCSLAYSEAQYIAKNDFRLGSVVMQQMSICSMDGHSRFMKRSWLKEFMRWQTEYGCFEAAVKESSLIKVSTKNEWRMIGRESTFIGGLCDESVTKLAAAPFAAAIRYIVEIW